MKNITITVDEDVARWARVWAAGNNTSVSRMLGRSLKKMMHDEQRYDAAKQRFLAKDALRLRDSEVSYPNRASLHER